MARHHHHLQYSTGHCSAFRTGLYASSPEPHGCHGNGNGKGNGKSTAGWHIRMLIIIIKSKGSDWRSLGQLQKKTALDVPDYPFSSKMLPKTQFWEFFWGNDKKLIEMDNDAILVLLSIIYFGCTEMRREDYHPNCFFLCNWAMLSYVAYSFILPHFVSATMRL